MRSIERRSVGSDDGGRDVRSRRDSGAGTVDRAWGEALSRLTRRARPGGEVDLVFRWNECENERCPYKAKRKSISEGEAEAAEQSTHGRSVGITSRSAC
eukprot:6187195-Pleurochrysis_carterae.AAC.4